MLADKEKKSQMGLIAIKHFSRYSILFVSFLVMISISNCAANVVDTQYSDLPPPPVKPERFTSKQQLKDYLVKLHEYYAIIGRPRFGRSSSNAFYQKQNTLNSFLYPKTQMDARLDSEAIANEMPQEQQQIDNSAAELVPISMIVELLDPNNDGFVSKQELYNFLKTLQKL